MISEAKINKILSYDDGRTKKICGYQPVIHRMKRVQEFLPVMKKEGTKRGKFSKPENLTILTMHDYGFRTPFEDSMDFLGVRDYVTLVPRKKWHHMMKLTLLIDYLESGKCETEYLLHCDARDSMLFDDPHLALSLFEDFNCEVVFNSTISHHHCFRLDSMQPLFWWGRKVNRTGQARRMLNSGAYIGRTKFIYELVKTGLDMYGDSIGETSPCPDQDILRVIQPWFWPKVKIDPYNDIFYRN